LTTVLVTLAIITGTGPIPLFAAQGAAASPSLSGRVFLDDGKTPVHDAVVKAFHRGTEEIFASQASGPDGSYVIEGLKPGDYDLGVSTAEGIYLVADAVPFAAGQRRAASFALTPSAQEPQPQGDEGQKAAPDEGQQTDPPPAEPEPKKEKKAKLKRSRAAGMSVRSPLIATGIVVGAAVVIGAVANSRGHDNDGDGSPHR
jgi:hypothetical protein